MIIESCLRELISSQVLGADGPAILREHAGKSFRVAAGPVSLSFRILADGTLEPVHNAVSADVTVRVPGPLSNDGKGSVQAQGDSALLSALGKVADEADLSPAALAQRAFGEEAGSAVAVCSRKGREWGSDACGRLGATVADWLTGESGLLPGAQEVRELSSGTMALARRVRELEARVEQAQGDRA